MLNNSLHWNNYFFIFHISIVFFLCFLASGNVPNMIFFLSNVMYLITKTLKIVLANISMHRKYFYTPFVYFQHGDAHWSSWHFHFFCLSGNVPNRKLFFLFLSFSSKNIFILAPTVNYTLDFHLSGHILSVLQLFSLAIFKSLT